MLNLLAFHDIASISDTVLQFCFEQMPPERQAKALRYRKRADYASCVIVYALLNKLLQRCYGMDDVPEIAYGAFGKPFFKHYQDIYFNMSHCRDGCVCGISDSPIGVDIQDIRHVSEDVIRRVCCHEERKLPSASDLSASAFISIWAQKEAYVKMTGAGLWENLRFINTLQLKDRILLLEDSGNYIAIASEAFPEGKSHVQLDYATTEYLESSSLL